MRLSSYFHFTLATTAMLALGGCIDHSAPNAPHTVFCDPGTGSRLCGDSAAPMGNGTAAGLHMDRGPQSTGGG